MSDFIQIIKERGFVHQFTNEENLQALTKAGPITAYLGFDCTAKSLHVGSLMQIMLLRILQQTGHKPLVLMGGGTTKIGDPSGKDEARKMLTDEIIQENKQSMSQVFKKYLTFGDNEARMVDNAEWLLNINYIDFLRDYGCHFSVNKMLSFDSVKLRLDRQQSLSFLEFNYMILQAYDFVELNRRYGCILQMGGSDQWGNIVNGVDLGKKVGTPELFGITTNLLTTSSGQKMGKTANGAVWLNEDMLSAYDFWQFWRNTEDADVVRFLKLFTELPLSEIEKLAKLGGKEINDAKIILANEVTTLCHGKEKALAAQNTAKSTFVDGAMSEGLSIFEIKSSSFPIQAHKLLSESGIVSSSGEAKRLIQGGGAKINDITIEDEYKVINLDIFKNDEAKLSSGKKKHIMLKLIF